MYTQISTIIAQLGTEQTKLEIYQTITECKTCLIPVSCLKNKIVLNLIPTGLDRKHQLLLQGKMPLVYCPLMTN